jgi:hypothetical protein
MNRLAAVSLLAAIAAAGACARSEAPTGPDAATRAVIANGVSLAKSACPKPTLRPSRPVQLQAIPHDPLPLSTVGVPPQLNVLFTNATCETVEMIWVRATGEQVSYGTLQPGETNVQLTYIGHVWLITRAHGVPYAAFRIEDHPSGDQEVYLGCTKGKNAVCN